MALSTLNFECGWPTTTDLVPFLPFFLSCISFFLSLIIFIAEDDTVWFCGCLFPSELRLCAFAFFLSLCLALSFTHTHTHTRTFPRLHSSGQSARQKLIVAACTKGLFHCLLKCFLPGNFTFKEPFYWRIQLVTNARECGSRFIRMRMIWIPGYQSLSSPISAILICPLNLHFS